MQRKSIMVNVVVMGGGTGQSVILKGLKEIENIHLTTIVTVADDGGSTGRLRHEFNMPAMGDIRNVMVALAEEQSLMADIMDYRFNPSDSESLGGHSLGNLILTALTQSTGSFMEAVGSVSKILNVKGDIIPSSLELLTLYARMRDGTIVRGESNIPLFKNAIQEVFYNAPVTATQEALKAIREADVILFGIGSLYTSILPNVIIEDIKKELEISKAKKVYYCNAMTQPGETDGYTGEDHVDALLRHCDIKLDYVVMNTTEILDVVRVRYQEEGSTEVMFDASCFHDYNLIQDDLLESKAHYVRHDSKKVKQSFEHLLEVMQHVI